jgi:hypothetical protein
VTHVPAFQATIRDGHIHPSQPDVLRAYLRRLDGQRVRLTVSKASEKRSTNANGYLWGVCYEAIAEWSGYTPEEVHALCKAMFIEPRPLNLGGKVVEIRSTAGMDSARFSAYVENVKRFAAEQGLYIPDPNEVG